MWNFANDPVPTGSIIIEGIVVSVAPIKVGLGVAPPVLKPECIDIASGAESKLPEPVPYIFKTCVPVGLLRVPWSDIWNILSVDSLTPVDQWLPLEFVKPIDEEVFDEEMWILCFKSP